MSRLTIRVISRQRETTNDKKPLIDWLIVFNNTCRSLSLSLRHIRLFIFRVLLNFAATLRLLCECVLKKKWRSIKTHDEYEEEAWQVKKNDCVRNVTGSKRIENYVSRECSMFSFTSWKYSTIFVFEKNKGRGYGNRRLWNNFRSGWTKSTVRLREWETGESVQMIKLWNSNNLNSARNQYRWKNVIYQSKAKLNKNLPETRANQEKS